MSSLHAAQALGAPLVGHDVSKKISHDDSSPIKVLGELHHHTDKSGAQLIKDAAEHQLYADNRSLRLLRHKKAIAFRRFAGRWQQTLSAWQHN